jgi:hypothetical protein
MQQLRLSSNHNLYYKIAHKFNISILVNLNALHSHRENDDDDEKFEDESLIFIEVNRRCDENFL